MIARTRTRASRYEFNPSNLTPACRDTYAKILARRGDFPLPYKALLSSPAVALSVDELSTLLWAGHLPKVVLESVFLVVARRFKCEHQWTRHETKALEAGVPRASISAIAAGLRPQGPEAVVIACQVAKRLLSGQRVESGLWAKAIAVLGEGGMADLCVLLGHASIVAMAINVQEGF